MNQGKRILLSKKMLFQVKEPLSYYRFYYRWNKEKSRFKYLAYTAY